MGPQKVAEELLTLTDTTVTSRLHFYQRDTSPDSLFISLAERMRTKIPHGPNILCSKLKAFPERIKISFVFWVESNF